MSEPTDTDDTPAGLGELAEEGLREAERAKVQSLRADVPHAQDPALERWFRVLGHDRGSYFFLPRGSRQLRAFTASQLGASSKAALLELAPLQWWEREFGGEKGFTGEAVTRALDWLIRAAQARGAFRVEQLRGRGVWDDDGRVVVHAGDRLYVDGAETPLHEIQSRYVYELGPALPMDAEHPHGPGDGADLLRLTRQWQWQQGELDAVLLAGWVVCAVASGALDWRPHLFVTGGRGCGKSTLLAPIMRILSQYAVFPEGGASTEAGIRAALGMDALPVVYDEADPADEESQRRVQAVLSLMRSASSASMGNILKGSKDQTGRAFAARSCFLLAGIRPPMEQGADTSRTSVLELRPIQGTVQQRQALMAEVIGPLVARLTDPSWSARFVARVLSRVPQLRADADTYSRAVALRLGSQRLGQQHGPLLAGAWSIMRDEPVTDAQAQAHVNRYQWAEQEGAAEQTDEDRLLALLLESTCVINVERTRYDTTIGELVGIASGHQQHATISARDAAAQLLRQGLTVTPPADSARRSQWLVVANEHRGVKTSLHGTAYHTGHSRVLRRLPGAESGPRMRFSGALSRTVQVPLSLLWGDGGGPP